jgi:hypothetical protein
VTAAKGRLPAQTKDAAIPGNKMVDIVVGSDGIEADTFVALIVQDLAICMAHASN